ncbi:MAG: AlkA N-terminal domain-containing protein [Propionibacteriaceae bacterium]
MTWHRLDLQVPEPFHGEALLVFFGRHAVPGVETYLDTEAPDGRRINYARTLRLTHGPALLRLVWAAGRLSAEVDLADDRDHLEAERRVGHLCDLGADITTIEGRLGRDAVLAPLVAASPGLRVPGVVDVEEHLFRTMIGQQISLAGAANCAGKLVARFGEPHGEDSGVSPSQLFPTAAALATADPETLPMPRARGRALVLLAEALAGGALRLDGDPADVRAALLAQRGIGPWTADYVLMRGFHEPDILLASDLVIKRELIRRQIADTSAWSPWRSYATMHLWRSWTG